MKKFASVVLALILALAMAVPAMAEGYTITIDNKTDGYEYAAYQIFAGDLSGTTLSNIKWGDGVDGAALLTELKKESAFATCSTAADVAEKLAAIKDKDNETTKKFADIVGQYLSTTSKTSAYDASNKKYTIGDLAAGYYLVKNTKVPDGTATDTAYTRYILEVVKDVEVAPKSAVPSVDKSIVEDNTDKEKNEASIGDTINYKWVGTLPSNIADYNTYYYSFNDTMDKGLTLTDTDSSKDGIQPDVQVEIVNTGTENVDVTKYFYIGAATEENGTTKLQVAIKDLLALRNIADKPTIDANTKIVVTYTATLNENAVVGTTGNKNKVDLTYSNDPNQDGQGTQNPPSENPEQPTPPTPVGKTPEDVVETFTTEIIIKKVDEKANVLTGAQFEISGNGVNVVVVTKNDFEVYSDGEYWKLKDGTYTKTAPTTEGETVNTDDYDNIETKYKATVSVETITKTSTTSVKAYVDDEGKVKFTGLGAGDYTIKETVTPPGYNTVADSTVTIGWKYENNACTWTYKWNNGNETNEKTVTIVNVAGSILPSTGGAGTVLIYAAGGLLVAAAIVLLISKRRADAR